MELEHCRIRIIFDKKRALQSPFFCEIIPFLIIERKVTNMRNYSTLNKYKDADTVIYDGMGWAHDGYLCPRCSAACPYLVYDCNGSRACYCDMYHRCQNDFEYEEEEL